MTIFFRVWSQMTSGRGVGRFLVGGGEAPLEKKYKLAQFSWASFTFEWFFNWFGGWGAPVQEPPPLPTPLPAGTTVRVTKKEGGYHLLVIIWEIPHYRITTVLLNL